MKICCLLVLLLSICATCLSAEAAQDPRSVLISQKQLVQKIRSTPLSSDEHFVLIRRALSSKLSQVAFAEYSSRWQKSQDDARANLFRGLAALRDMEVSMYSMSTLKRANYLRDVVRSSLSKAHEKGPADSAATLAYGYYLWQYDRQRSRGLDLMLDAERTAPLSPTVQSTLGAVYAESSQNPDYNPQKAIEHLRTAIRLDPLSSGPRWTLAHLYAYNLRQFQLAQKEFNECKKLLPTHAVGDPTVANMQSYISMGLKRKSR